MMLLHSNKLKLVLQWEQVLLLFNKTHKIGSDVAKEASDLVLLDNNFASTIAGIQSGRLVHENLQKVILYLIPAGSFSELLPILSNILLGLPLPLSPFLMIYICVITGEFSFNY